MLTYWFLRHKREESSCVLSSIAIDITNDLALVAKYVARYEVILSPPYLLVLN